MDVDQKLRIIDSEIERLIRQRAIIEQKRAFLEELEGSFFFSGEELNFTGLSHPESVKVFRHFGGKWHKTYKADAIDYTLYQSEGHPFQVCVYNGQPPENCRIEAVEVDVPAPYVPAH